jgi:uncharacterized repeat protein (TIGR01451 family)
VLAPQPASDTLISNLASVTAENEPFANAGNNKDIEETVVLAPRSDVTIDKSDLGTDPVGSAGAISYTLTVNNSGPQPATNVTVVDTLPPGVSFVSASPACGAPVAGVITCSLGTLPSGGQTSLNISINAPVAVQDVLLKNVARVSADNELFAQTGNNMDVENTAVIAPAPDLEIVKSGPPAVRRVATFQYTLSVRNHGGGAAKDVHVTDVLPTATVSGSPQPMVFVSAMGASCAPTVPQTVECNIPLVPANGGEVIITMTVRAPTVLTDTSLVNSSSVLDPDEPDDPSGNNADTATTLIHACFDVTGDGKTSGLDFFALFAAFGAVPPGPPYSLLLDLNGDGAISGLDFFPMLSKFGQVCSP